MNIQEVFDTFVTALEKNRMELLETVLDEKVEIYSSAHGIFTGRKEAKERHGKESHLITAKSVSLIM